MISTVGQGSNHHPVGLLVGLSVGPSAIL